MSQLDPRRPDHSRFTQDGQWEVGNDREERTWTRGEGVRGGAAWYRLGNGEGGRGTSLLLVDSADRTVLLLSLCLKKMQKMTWSWNTCKPGIERVQVLADILRLALCCHSNETRAPIKSVQLCTTRGHPYRSPKLQPGPYSSVGTWRGTSDRHTDGRDQYTFRLGYASREM